MLFSCMFLPIRLVNFFELVCDHFYYLGIYQIYLTIGQLLIIVGFLIIDNFLLHKFNICEIYVV